ncbi:1-phosphofructokinase, partial [Streptomyces albidoflavus]
GSGAGPRRSAAAALTWAAAEAGSVAGLLAGLAEGADWPDRLVRAAALSAATVHASAAGEYDEAAYRDLAARITATALPGAA